MNIEINIDSKIIAIGLKAVLELNSYKGIILSKPTFENLLITDNLENIKKANAIVFLYIGQKSDEIFNYSIIDAHVEEEELLYIIEETLKGRAIYSKKIGRYIEGKTEIKTLIETLDQRELQIYNMLRLGYTNKKIGSKLYLSEKTIKNNLTTIYKKLNISGRKDIKVLTENIRDGNI